MIKHVISVGETFFYMFQDIAKIKKLEPDEIREYALLCIVQGRSTPPNSLYPNDIIYLPNKDEWKKYKETGENPGKELRRQRALKKMGIEEDIRQIWGDFVGELKVSDLDGQDWAEDLVRETAEYVMKQVDNA